MPLVVFYSTNLRTFDLIWASNRKSWDYQASMLAILYGTCAKNFYSVGLYGSKLLLVVI